MVALPLASASTAALPVIGIREGDFAGAVLVTGNALLLVARNLRSPLDRVVAMFLGPIGDPVELILGLFQRAIAAIHSQRVSEIKPAVAVDVEGRHAAGGLGSQVQTGQTRLRGRIGTHTERFHADSVAEGPKAELADQGGAESVSESQRQALVAVQGLAGEVEEGGPARFRPKCRRRFDGEVRQRVTSEEVGFLRDVVVHANIGLIDIENLGAGSDVIVKDRARSAPIGLREISHDIG